MPKQSGGAQQLRRGDRVRIKLNGCYRYYLNGMLGNVTAVLHHGCIVTLDSDHTTLQRTMGAGGQVGPTNPTIPQRQFQFHEVEKVNP